MGPMSLGEWLIGFKRLHAKAVKSALSPSEGVSYYRGRNELARLLFGLQQLTLQPSHVPRQWIRVCHPLQVDLEFEGLRVQVTTVDLCLGGFGTTLHKEQATNTLARYVLHLPSAEPLAGQARVMETKLSETGYRTSFNFQELSDGERERLEFFIFDLVLARIA